MTAMEHNGELAQLARAPALHAGGHRFDSDILHYNTALNFGLGQYCSHATYTTRCRLDSERK